MITAVDKSQVRVWIYRSLKKLTPELENEILNRGNAFVGQWAAHGKKLAAEFKIFHHHYLVFFVDQAWAQNTGCSIDASVALIKSLENEFQLGLLDRMQMGFLKNDEVEFHHFNEIREKLQQGVLSEDVIILNPLVQNLEEFEKSFAQKLSESSLI